jgi:hypothetical protein
MDVRQVRLSRNSGSDLRGCQRENHFNYSSPQQRQVFYFLHGRPTDSLPHCGMQRNSSVTPDLTQKTFRQR